jgi:hypothetical protein
VTHNCDSQCRVSIDTAGGASNYRGKADHGISHSTRLPALCAPRCRIIFRQTGIGVRQEEGLAAGRELQVVSVQAPDTRMMIPGHIHVGALVDMSKRAWILSTLCKTRIEPAVSLK